MARLPQPGGDTGNWGTILNEFLSATHTTDGGFKPGVIQGSHLADGSITTDKLADASITTTKLASSVQTTLSSVVTTSNVGVAGGIAGLDSSGKVPASQLPEASGGTTPEASATVSGTIRLSGDLGGTASSPTVTKLSGVSLSGTPSAGQALVATSSTVAGWQSISTGGSTNPNAGTVWNTASDPATGATASSVKDGDMWVDTSHATLVSLKNRINGQWVEVSSATKPAPQVSDLVTGLTVTNPTSTGVTLSWTAPANPSGTVDGYHVYNNGTKITTTPLTVTTYNVTLPAETAYSLTVAVVVAGEEKTPSPATTGTTPAGNNTTSDLVTGLSVSNLAQTSLTLSWTAPTNPSGTVAGYNVYVGSSSTPANGSTPIPASTLTYQVTGLTANTDYTLNVKTLVGTTESQAVSATAKTTSGTVTPGPTTPLNTVDFAGRGRPRLAANSWVYANHHAAGVDPLNNAAVAELVTAMNVSSNGYVGQLVNVPTNDWSIGYYVASPSTPRYKMDHADYQWAPYKLDYHKPDGSGQLDRVPLESNWVAPGGSDKPMIIYLPEEDTLWELWCYGGIIDAGNKIARCFEGGMIPNLSQTTDCLHKGAGGKYGISGSALAMGPIMMMADDFAKGSVDHAMYLAIGWEWVAAPIYPPATHTDGYSGATAQVLGESMRFILPQDLDLTPYNLPPVARMVGEAMKQGHPLVIADRTDKGGNLGAEHAAGLAINTGGEVPSSFYDDKWGGVDQWAQFKDFPFDKCILAKIDWMPA